MVQGYQIYESKEYSSGLLRVQAQLEDLSQRLEQ